MKNEPLRLGMALMIFGIVLFGLTCDRGNQNQVATTQNLASPTAAPLGKPLDPEPQCNVADLQQRRDDVNAEINNRLAQKLKNSNVNAQVNVVDQHLEVVLNGAVNGPREGRNLTKELHKFLKKECVEIISFVPVTRSGPGMLIDGFRWTSCQDPEVACDPEGECRRQPC